MAEKLKPGLYESLLDELLGERIQELGDEAVQIGDVDAAESAIFLAEYVRSVAEKALTCIEGKGRRRLEQQIQLANRAIQVLSGGLESPGEEGISALEAPARLLLAVRDPGSQGLGTQAFPPRPGIPLSRDDLLVNARDEISLGVELRREIPSADRIDLLCSFIKWAGIRLLRDELRDWLRPGRKLRVMTTTYVGVTELRALEELQSMGADIRVSYDTRRTRLHAKAWLFHRDSGYSTAFIGSSNLSASAMTDGAEWNVRLSQANSPGLLTKFARAYDGYWEEGEFERFDPERFKVEIGRNRADTSEDPGLYQIDLRPYPFQQEILERLEVERDRHGRMQNLVVAATGTGKTVMAALDFRREWQRRRVRGQDFRLLFVAHREEILRQSRSVFRLAMRDKEFGEILGGGEEPLHGHDVFASIMSLKNRLDASHPRPLSPDAYDMVIVDEVHHSEAESYVRLLDFVRPKILLGLTATPERSDGRDVFKRFGERATVELRLWDALELRLLAPFHYFGIFDETDLSQVRWTRGRYAPEELENIYTSDHRRVQIILNETRDKIADVASMRALGFCVSVDHARFMAGQFLKHGIQAEAIHGGTADVDRRGALRRVREGRTKVLFAVDLFNEGVDVPEVNTLLFLRPTESATVFLQQLGRGLRFSQNKEVLTVLDFIGHSHKCFRFDRKYRGLLQGRGQGLRRHIEKGFPWMPAGCTMRLDRQAEEVVLASVRAAVAGATGPVIDALRDMGDVGLEEFLSQMGWDLSDLYRKRSERWTWANLRREAGLPTGAAGVDETIYARGLSRVLHVDDRLRLGSWRKWLGQEVRPDASKLDETERRLLAMLHFVLWGVRRGEQGHDLDAVIKRLWGHPAILAELSELLALLEKGAEHLERNYEGLSGVPLLVHGRYSRDEILAAFDDLDPRRPVPLQAGVRRIETHRADLFFVTVQKSLKDYSPDTMYRDGALSQSLFQWDSQNATSPMSPTGKRYINHDRDGNRIYLFVRPAKVDARGVTAPYTFLGPAHYLSHEGSRPMAIRWELDFPIPGWFYPRVRLVA